MPKSKRVRPRVSISSDDEEYTPARLKKRKLSHAATPSLIAPTSEQQYEKATGTKNMLIQLSTTGKASYVRDARPPNTQAGQVYGFGAMQTRERERSRASESKSNPVEETRIPDKETFLSKFISDLSDNSADKNTPATLNENESGESTQPPSALSSP